MAAALSTSLALPPLPATLLPKPKPPFFPATQIPFPTLILSTTTLSSLKIPDPRTRPRIGRSNAANGDSPVTDAVATDSAGELLTDAASSGDGVATIISVLLFVAFIGLSVLTVGVVYLAVTDFLQKRERDKLEKEEAAKKKKRSGGKKRVRARVGGPRGFGQKIEEDEDD